MSHNLNHFSTHEEYKSGIFPMAFACQAKIQRLPIFCSLAIKKRIDAANAQYGIYGVGYGDSDVVVLGPRYLYLDGATGKLFGDFVPGSGTAADIFEAWQFPLHNRRLIGLPDLILISLTGLAVVLLCCSCLLIWHKRKARRSKKSKPVRHGSPPSLAAF